MNCCLREVPAFGDLAIGETVKIIGFDDRFSLSGQHLDALPEPLFHDLCYYKLFHTFLGNVMDYLFAGQRDRSQLLIVKKSVSLIPFLQCAFGPLHLLMR